MKDVSLSGIRGLIQERLAAATVAAARPFSSYLLCSAVVGLTVQGLILDHY